MTRRNSSPHQPTDACRDDHCYSCGVDEPLGRRYYILCGECFHVYYTKGALRRAYRREMWRIHRAPPNDYLEAVFPRIPPPPTRKVIWKLVTVRAKNINFCQECIHDF
jgi:hypothetical protein